MTRAVCRDEPGDLIAVPAELVPMVGKTFGQLTVVGYTGKLTNRRQKMLACHCTCGSYLDVRPGHLRAGQTTSCGCAHRKQLQERNVAMSTHGHASGNVLTPEYRAWGNMISRCHNPQHDAWQWYGARGIVVCDSWRADFMAFFNAVGARPSRAHSIHRIEPNGNYEPGNVKWATPKEQARHLSTSVYYELDGEKRNLAEWAEMAGMDYGLLRSRVVLYGWGLREAMSIPAMGGGRVPYRLREAARGVVDTGKLPVPETIRLRRVWSQMIDRCTNPNNRAYPDYGGRGIKVCDHWSLSVDNYVSDILSSIGPRPSPQHTLDRINNAHDYEPGNIAWSTATEQTRNRRNSKRYELNGTARPLAEWAELAGMPYGRVKQRVLTYKWPLDEALGTPIGSGRCPPSERRKWTEKPITDRNVVDDQPDPEA